MKKLITGLLILASTSLYSADYQGGVYNSKIERRGLVKAIQGVPQKVRKGKNYTTTVNDITVYYQTKHGELTSRDISGNIVLSDKIDDVKYVYTAEFTQKYEAYDGEWRTGNSTDVVFSDEKLTNESFERKYNKLLYEVNTF